MNKLTWKQCWNRLNDELANECSDGDITEEEMEHLLDHASLASTADELREFCKTNGYSLAKSHEVADEFDDEWHEGLT